MEIKNNSVSNVQIRSLDTKSYGPSLQSDQAPLTTIRVEDVPKVANLKNGNNETNNTENLEDTVKDLNSTFEKNGVSLAYSQDEKTGKTIVQLLDMSTKEVIKQIPTKEMLAIADNIGKYLDSYSKKGAVGKPTTELLINQKA